MVFYYIFYYHGTNGLRQMDRYMFEISEVSNNGTQKHLQVRG